MSFMSPANQSGFPPICLEGLLGGWIYNLATCLDDLKEPPSNRLHALKEDREGQHSISINDQWRICFRFIDRDAYYVEITDYH